MFSGVMLSGGVICTAYFAVHHPQSVIGRVLHGASHVAALVNPVSGLTPLARHAEARHATAEEQAAEAGESDHFPTDPVPVPDDPVPVAADEVQGNTPEPGPIVVSNTGTAPIIICEDEKPCVPPLPEWEGSLPAVAQSAPIEPDGAISPTAAECPADVSATAPPALMPYCHDEAEFELLPMPTEEPECLPMPRPVEEDEDGLSLHKGPISDGQLLHCVGYPAGTEAPSKLIHGSLRRKLSIFPDEDDENCPLHPEIDTMEFRPSDRHLYDYGPGSL
jgi:hypothetical protein